MEGSWAKRAGCSHTATPRGPEWEGLSRVGTAPPQEARGPQCLAAPDICPKLSPKPSRDTSGAEALFHSQRVCKHRMERGKPLWEKCRLHLPFQGVWLSASSHM